MSRKAFLQFVICIELRNPFPILQETQEAPAYWEASLWRDGEVIQTKFLSLSLQEQIEAARYVAKTYDHSAGYEGDATTTLMRFFCFWMKHPKDSQQGHLVELIDEYEMSLSQKQWSVFIDCFEFLVGKTDQ